MLVYSILYIVYFVQYNPQSYPLTDPNPNTILNRIPTL